MVGAMRSPGWLHEQHPPFGHIHMVDIIGQRQPILDLRRLERSRSLDQRHAADEGLRQHIACILAEHIDAAGPLGRLHADGNGEGARLDHRVAHRIGDEEPILALDRQPLHLLAVDRPITL